MAMCIGLRPEKADEYKRLHANVWPEVLFRISASNIRDDSIFLREPQNLLFATFEADMAAMARDQKTRDWSAIPASSLSRRAHGANVGRHDGGFPAGLRLDPATQVRLRGVDLFVHKQDATQR